jgi:hypothetical protein
MVRLPGIKQIVDKSQTAQSKQGALVRRYWEFFSKKESGLAVGPRLDNQCEFARVILRKQVGCPGTSVKEQALPDLTPSILATIPRMSNMFLHFRQVIDSRRQKGWVWVRKLWKCSTIKSIKVLNKRMIVPVLSG